MLVAGQQGVTCRRAWFAPPPHSHPQGACFATPTTIYHCFALALALALMKAPTLALALVLAHLCVDRPERREFVDRETRRDDAHCPPASNKGLRK